MSKTLKFSPEKEKIIHEILARALMRAVENGTYFYIPASDEIEEKRNENENKVAQ